MHSISLKLFSFKIQTFGKTERQKSQRNKFTLIMFYCFGVLFLCVVVTATTGQVNTFDVSETNPMATNLQNSRK